MFKSAYKSIVSLGEEGLKYLTGINNNTKVLLTSVLIRGTLGDVLPSGARMPIGYVNRNKNISIEKAGNYNSKHTNKIIDGYLSKYDLDIQNNKENLIISDEQEQRMKRIVQCALYDFTQTKQIQIKTEEDVKNLLKALHESGGIKILGNTITIFPGRETHLPIIGNTRASDNINYTTDKNDVIQILNNKIDIK